MHKMANLAFFPHYNSLFWMLPLIVRENKAGFFRHNIGCVPQPSDAEMNFRTTLQEQLMIMFVSVRCWTSSSKAADDVDSCCLYNLQGWEGCFCFIGLRFKGVNKNPGYIMLCYKVHEGHRCSSVETLHRHYSQRSYPWIWHTLLQIRRNLGSRISIEIGLNMCQEPDNRRNAGCSKDVSLLSIL